MSEQMNRVATPFTNEHFMAFCEKMLGQPYWYGTCLYKATNSLLSRKTSQYPSSYATFRTMRYRQDVAAKKIVADCIGAAKGYAWTGGGIGVLEAIGTEATYTSRYGSNGCPDKGANSMFTYAKSKGMDWGVIGTLPEIVGLALTKTGHVGYYVGNGYAIEWKGFSYGCVKTKVAGRGWTHWYKLPFIQYGAQDATIPKQEYTLRSRLLTKGITGVDVKSMQELLLQLGYALPKYGADADFGSETERAVVTFQKKQGLIADGKYGEETYKAVMAAIADNEAGKPDAPSATEKSAHDEQCFFDSILEI